MTFETFKAYCLSKSGAWEDYPFDERVCVFKVFDKMFALCVDEEPLHVNLKCDPIYALELRSLYSAVSAGYHMNKKHWNTIEANSDVDDNLLKELVDDSYALIVSKLTKKQKTELRNEDSK